jgi:hypothetical protein
MSFNFFLSTEPACLVFDLQPAPVAVQKFKLTESALLSTLLLYRASKNSVFVYYKICILTKYLHILQAYG